LTHDDCDFRTAPVGSLHLALHAPTIECSIRRKPVASKIMTETTRMAAIDNVDHENIDRL
jgi:hypothetical protein